MDEFTFLRPLWLLALPLAPYLAWCMWRRLYAGDRWRRACDPELLPHLLVNPYAVRQAWPFWLLALGGIAAVLALAGPAWERLDQQVYRTLNARVLVLDLSRSMDASDLLPSRLVRARFKVVDVLRKSRDRPVGLAVFAGDGFIVTPLTQDANTLISLLPSVDTSIMPVQGSRADLGLEAAARMLERGGARRGEVVLITDGVKGRRAAAQAAKLRASGFRVSVLAAGTPEGAPIPVSGGGFLKDLSGSIVIPGSDYRALRAIAHAGGGHFAPLSHDDTDIDTVLGSAQVQPWELDTQAVDRTSEAWRERGPWLALLLLPVAALAFRRGWLLVIPLAIGVAAPPAEAVTWADLWARPDQQASRALDSGDPAKAAAVAKDPGWRGSALYRNRQFDEAAKAFAEHDGGESDYNRGNALAKAGRLREALEAYEQILQREPDHEDAGFNRDLVERLLEQLQQQARQQPRQRDSKTGEPNQSREGGEQARRRDRPEPGQQGDSEQPRPDRAEAGEQEEARPDPSGEARPVDPSRQMADVHLTPEESQAIEQWLRRIPDDPGGLLRRKFQLEYQKRTGEAPRRSDAW